MTKIGLDVMWWDKIIWKISGVEERLIGWLNALKISPEMELFLFWNKELILSLLENKKVNVLLSPEKNREKDFIHYRNSGLNQVLCNLAKRNGIAIGFDFNNVLNAQNKEEILGRMMQNVRLCRKYKIRMLIFDLTNERSKEELRSFCVVLGMTPGEAKGAVNFKYL